MQCDCGLVMTCRAFDYHMCAVGPVPVVIDLTLDDSDDSTVSQPMIIDLTEDLDNDSQ
jgi:hypothetical protein